MLPKNRKISKKSFIGGKRDSQNKSGYSKRIEIKDFSVLILKTLRKSKYSIIISGKLVKGAVERNSFRRKFYNTIKNLNIKDGFLFFFYLKSLSTNIKLRGLENQVTEFFKEQQFLTNKNKK